MHWRRLLPVLVLAIVCLATAVPAALAEAELPEAASNVCREFFEMIDQNKLKESFKLLTPELQKIETPVLWYGQLSAELGGMGRPGERKLTEVKTIEKFGDLPRGSYTMAVFANPYESHTDAQEQVILAETGGGGYGVVGYRIEYNRWPEAISLIGNGLFVVFFIMALLAFITWLVGRFAQATGKKKATEGGQSKKG